MAAPSTPPPSAMKVKELRENLKARGHTDIAKLRKAELVKRYEEELKNETAAKGAASPASPRSAITPKRLAGRMAAPATSPRRGRARAAAPKSSPAKSPSPARGRGRARKSTDAPVRRPRASSRATRRKAPEPSPLVPVLMVLLVVVVAIGVMHIKTVQDLLPRQLDKALYNTFCKPAMDVADKVASLLR
ncbi:unnamed protein product [Pedinophyceae sp. YPF-701]|nr:unnamed protein product [Pedinophyceae sp. YPF-701]